MADEQAGEGEGKEKYPYGVTFFIIYSKQSKNCYKHFFSNMQDFYLCFKIFNVLSYQYSALSF